MNDQHISPSEDRTQLAYEAPRLSVLGTLDELTKVKGTTSNDMPASGHKSV